MIDFDIESELRPNLSKDEKLLWTGRPQTGIKFQAADAFMIPFTFVWAGGAFTIFGFMLLSKNAPLFILPVPILFVIAGLYITVGRFFFDSRRRQNTVYGITADRIIIKSGVFNKELKSLNLRTLSDITINEKSNGSGTIALGTGDWRSAMLGNMAWPGVKQQPQLQFINNVQDVYHLIVKLQQQ